MAYVYNFMSIIPSIDQDSKIGILFSSKKF